MPNLNITNIRNALDNDHLVDVLKKTCQRGGNREKHEDLKDHDDCNAKKSQCDTVFVKMSEQEYMSRERETFKTSVKTNTEFARTGIVINSYRFELSVSLDGTILGKNLLGESFTGKKDEGESDDDNDDDEQKPKKLKVEERRRMSVDPNQEYPVVIVASKLGIKTDGTASIVKNGTTIGFSQAKVYIATLEMGVPFGILIDRNARQIPVIFEDRAFECNVKQAIEWAHKVEIHGDSMVVDPPSCIELYPNMRHPCLDDEIESKKYELAKKNKEFTLMAGVSVETRNKMILKYDVDRMDDPNSTIERLIPESQKATRKSVGALLDANKREKDLTPIQNITEYKEGDAGLDFETLKHGFEGWKIAFLFMIGFSYNNDTCFEGIRVLEITKEEQLRILNHFLKRMEELKIRRLIHWGHFEKTIFSALENYYKIEILHRFEMFDLKVMIGKIPWAPKGAFTYSVKSFGKALYNAKLIETTWTTECTNGSSAAYDAWVAYVTKDSDTLEDIQEYNKVDVIVMMQIYNYMRSIGILNV